ncbi:HalOD1 output domain-containing protein [Haladaptatus sp. DFWS20]|uniref:HalOD1 output domain-containing protein n=1 Tax=Haladaptatus sp. DFWS20 TaxID=3403467 RepID=UPI003EBBF5DC
MGSRESPQRYTIRPNERASEAVIRAVSSADDRDLHWENPLYDHIDPDALDSLFHPHRDRLHDDTTVHFDYCGYTVVVSAETVELR